MNIQAKVTEDDPLVKLVRFAAKTESAAEMRGDIDGFPFLAIVVTGANVGIVERLMREGRLMLTPNKR